MSALEKKSTFLNKDLYFYYVFLIVGIIFIYTTDKAQSFLIINQYHSPFLNTIMPYVTFLGDGFFSAIIALAFMIYKLRPGIYLGLSFLVSGLTVQILKRFVFEDKLRPIPYFEDLGIDIITSGYDGPLLYSFPSGHTTTAFACFIGISFLVKQWYLKVLLLLVAISVGYSRVYLAVHFPIDVVAGSLLGVLSSYIFYLWVFKWEKNWLDQSPGSRIFKSKVK
jgi:membrane-associated phospholipid phosphatase